MLVPTHGWKECGGGVAGQLTGRRKAAVLLLSLGPDTSAQVYKHLTEPEIEELTLEIAGVQSASPDERAAVLEEYRSLVTARAHLGTGGVAYAREILERSMGSQKALEMLQRLTQNLQARPFDLARRADARQLLGAIQNEHPQTIALVLTYIQSERAAQILAGLDPERQADVARRMALMERAAPEVVREVERVLDRKLSMLVSAESVPVGGIDAVVEVLNRVDRATERSILDTLGNESPDLAEEIKRRMFLFEDIVRMDDRSLQRALREIDMEKDMPLALKAASAEVKEKVLRNVSQRAGENLKDNLEFLGPVRLHDVEAAQQRIVGIIRRLEEEGEVVIARGAADEMVV